jgi:hypothetical protein
MADGRPLKFPDVETLQAAIDRYFADTDQAEWTVKDIPRVSMMVPWRYPIPQGRRRQEGRRQAAGRRLGRRGPCRFLAPSLAAGRAGGTHRAANHRPGLRAIRADASQPEQAGNKRKEPPQRPRKSAPRKSNGRTRPKTSAKGRTGSKHVLGKGARELERRNGKPPGSDEE